MHVRTRNGLSQNGYGGAVLQLCSGGGAVVRVVAVVLGAVVPRFAKDGPQQGSDAIRTLTGSVITVTDGAHLMYSKRATEYKNMKIIY